MTQTIENRIGVPRNLYYQKLPLQTNEDIIAYLRCSQ